MASFLEVKYNKEFDGYQMFITTQTCNYASFYNSAEGLNAAYDHLQKQIAAEDFHIEKGFGKVNS